MNIFRKKTDRSELQKRKSNLRVKHDYLINFDIIKNVIALENILRADLRLCGNQLMSCNEKDLIGIQAKCSLLDYYIQLCKTFPEELKKVKAEMKEVEEKIKKLV